MRIDKLSLLNFRCFRQLDITFDEHITILVAPNGAGKTTVLDAIRLALFPFIRGFDASLYVKDKSLAIRTEDVRLVFRPEALNMEMSSPATDYGRTGERGKVEKRTNLGCSTSEENSRRM
ncbi:ATP-binding protein, partial [Salmonella enterica subsp. enterica serovar Newport str. S09097]